MTSQLREVSRHLGIDPKRITGAEMFSSSRHGHSIWRVRIGEESFVIKWYPDESSEVVEIGAYKLLRELGVPTLKVYHITERAILLEDLDSSEKWRLASKEDVTLPQVGAAIGHWYKILHERGSDLLQRQQRKPPFLKRETAILTEQSIADTARALGMVENPVWQVAIDSLALLRKAECSLSMTLNYNDFHWTNLALSRGRENPKAVIFDYHLLGVGMRYSDCRNATDSLGPRAAAAFWDEYGSVNPNEIMIDRPLSTLHALVVAAGLPKFPSWARGSMDLVVNGDLLRDLREAIDLAKALL